MFGYVYLISQQVDEGAKQSKQQIEDSAFSSSNLRQIFCSLLHT